MFLSQCPTVQEAEEWAIAFSLGNYWRIIWGKRGGENPRIEPVLGVPPKALRARRCLVVREHRKAKKWG